MTGPLVRDADFWFALGMLAFLALNFIYLLLGKVCGIRRVGVALSSDLARGPGLIKAPHPTRRTGATLGTAMSEKQPTDQRLDRQLKELIGQQLKDYYHSCLSQELPPRLLAVLKKLDEETEVSESKLK